jgi:hypothetical protein
VDHHTGLRSLQEGPGVAAAAVSIDTTCSRLHKSLPRYSLLHCMGLADCTRNLEAAPESLLVVDNRCIAVVVVDLCDKDQTACYTRAWQVQHVPVALLWWIASVLLRGWWTIVARIMLLRAPSTLSWEGHLCAVLGG